jgi:hypothetical protein
MRLEDYIIIAIVLAIVGAVSLYIRRQKKKGSKCIGCPYGAACEAKAKGRGCSNS